jgi:hypothetical protein
MGSEPCTVLGSCVTMPEGVCPYWTAWFGKDCNLEPTSSRVPMRG